MSISTMSTIFESAERSSTEYSDELMAALAAGRWWAIMDVSDPISEEPEDIEDLISSLSYGIVDAGRTSCPTSLVRDSGFSLKTTKHWRQGALYSSRSTRGAPVPARSTQGAPVPARSTQGASVPTRSTQRAPGPTRSTQGASVPARSTQGAPVHARSMQGAPGPARSTQGAPVPARSTQGASVPTRSTQGASVPARSTHGAPVSASSEKGGLTSSLAFSDASEKAQHSGFSDATLKTTEQRRKWTQKKPQGAPVPAGSRQEPHVPIRSQQRGKLSIPEYLTRHLSEASFETAMHAKSLQRAPVAASKEHACSPHGAPMPDKTAARLKLKIPEPLRSELLQQGAPVPAKSTLGAPVPNRSKQGSPVPARSTHGAPMPDKTAARPKLKIPEPLRSELLQQGTPVPARSTLRAPVPTRSKQGSPVPARSTQGASVPASSEKGGLTSSLVFSDASEKVPNLGFSDATLKIESVCCAMGAPAIDTISEWVNLNNPELLSKELLRKRLQNAPVLVPASSLRIPKQQWEKWREVWEQQQNSQKEVSVHAKTPQRTFVPPCSPQQPLRSPQGAAMPSWSTEAPVPPQKLCVEIVNPTPQITSSKLNLKTQSSLHSRTQLTRKRALDNAGVDQSPPQKKPHMAIEVQDHPSDPSSIEKMYYLCRIFSKFCVISNL